MIHVFNDRVEFDPNSLTAEEKQEALFTAEKLPIKKNIMGKKAVLKWDSEKMWYDYVPFEIHGEVVSKPLEPINEHERKHLAFDEDNML